VRYNGYGEVIVMREEREAEKKKLFRKLYEGSGVEVDLQEY